MASTINAKTTGVGGIDASGDASGVLALQTGRTTAVTIDASQNVGIGMVPAQRVDVKAVSSLSAAAIQTQSFDGLSSVSIYSGIYSTDNPSIIYQNALRFGSATGLGTTGYTERMRIDSSGNVGIGTASPGNKLDVTGNININNGSYGISIPPNSQGGFGLQLRGDTNASSRNWQILSNTSAYGLLDFQVSSTNAVSGFTSKMVIDSSGNVLVGTTSQIYSGAKLQINGIIAGVGYGTRAGATGSFGTNAYSYYWTGSALQAWIDGTNVGTVTLVSDYRIKKDIVTQDTPAIARINQLRPVTYERADYKEIYKADGVAREGFIAHELQAIIPSAVEGEKDAENQIQSLNLDALCSVMVKAIQELKAIIDTQQQIMADLNTRITALEAK